MTAPISYGPFLGIANKLDPNHIARGYVSYACDVEFGRGTIKPMRTDRYLDAGVGKTVYAGDCCLKTFPTCVDITSHNFDCERVFASGIKAYPVQGLPDNFCKEVYCRMGFPCSIAAPTVAYGGASQTTLEAEPRSYVYTYVNSFGEESQPSLPSPLVTVDFLTTAAISGFVVPPAEYCIKLINVYQLTSGQEQASTAQAGESAWLRVAQLPATQMSFTHDPTIQTYSASLTTSDFVPVPDDATDLQHFGTNQLAFQSQGQVRFTEPFNYSLAPLKYAYKPADGLLEVAATPQWVYMLTCGRPEVLQSQGACDGSGQRKSAQATEIFPLIGRQSVATYGSSVIFASVAGLVIMNGADAQLFSENIFTREDWDALQPHTMRGVVYNGFYYCASDVAAFRVEIPRGAKSGQDSAFCWLSIRPTAMTVTQDDRLIFADITGTYELEQGGDFKQFKVLTEDTHSHSPWIHGAFCLQLRGKGSLPTSIGQWITFDGGGREEYKTTVMAGGMYRFPRRSGDSVQYEIIGNTEVISLAVGPTVQSITSTR